MGLEYLFVVRLSDGLVLVAITDSTTAAVTTSQSTSMTNNLRARTAGAAQPAGARDLKEGRDLLLQLNSSSAPRASVDGEALTYHYAINSPLVCFVATDKQ